MKNMKQKPKPSKGKKVKVAKKPKKVEAPEETVEEAKPQCSRCGGKGHEPNDNCDAGR
jgi:hypothetical protein